MVYPGTVQATDEAVGSTLAAVAGNQDMFGNDGDDVYEFSLAAFGHDTVIDTSGTDTISLSASGLSLKDVRFALNGDRVFIYDSANTITIDGRGAIETYTEHGISYAIGSTDATGADLLLGTSSNDTITASAAGNDILAGGDGSDVLDGGVGDDRLLGGMGNDTYVIGNGMLSGNDTIVERPMAGEDTVLIQTGTSIKDVYVNGNDIEMELSISTAMGHVTLVDQVVQGGIERFHYDGVTYIPVLAGHGSFRGEIVAGTLGNDVITSSGGTDILFGSGGDDTYSFASGWYDTTTIIDDAGVNTLILPTLGGVPDTTRQDGSDLVIDTGSGQTIRIVGQFDGTPVITNFQLYGQVYGEMIVGTTAADTSLPSPGATGGIIVSGTGIDFLTGGAGNDYLSGGPGGDVVRGNGGNDIIVHDPLDDVDGGTGFDALMVRGGMFDAGGLAATNFVGMEALMADADQAQSLRIDVAAFDVLTAATGGVLYVVGDDDDTLSSDVTWVAGGTHVNPVDGKTYATYTYNDGTNPVRTLHVDTDVNSLGIVDPATLSGSYYIGGNGGLFQTLGNWTSDPFSPGGTAQVSGSITVNYDPGAGVTNTVESLAVSDGAEVAVLSGTLIVNTLSGSGGSLSVENTGTLQTGSGSTIDDFGMTFGIMEGTLTVQQAHVADGTINGTLSITGTSHSGVIGDVTVGSTGSLEVTGGNVTFQDATVSGAGSVSVAGATVNVVDSSITTGMVSITGSSNVHVYATATGVSQVAGSTDTAIDAGMVQISAEAGGVAGIDLKGGTDAIAVLSTQGLGGTLGVVSTGVLSVGQLDARADASLDVADATITNAFIQADVAITVGNALEVGSWQVDGTVVLDGSGSLVVSTGDALTGQGSVSLAPGVDLQVDSTAAGSSVDLASLQVLEDVSHITLDAAAASEIVVTAASLAGVVGSGDRVYITGGADDTVRLADDTDGLGTGAGWYDTGATDTLAGVSYSAYGNDQDTNMVFVGGGATVVTGP